MRPVRPEDAGPLAAGFELLEPAAVRTRLFGAAALEGTAAQRFVRPNPKTEFVLVATDESPPGEAVIAALGHVRNDPVGHLGTLHILSGRFVTGQGVARYLLTRLVKWARGRGLGVLEGVVPADNAPLLEQAAALGFVPTPPALDADPALVTLRLDLPAR
ncbi:GNAT family N-acetyltransferase [Lysobacter humi (ex Lee et al. 2017)]